MNRFIIGMISTGAILLGSSHTSRAGDLEIKIDGISREEGTVRVALFASEDDYKADRAYAQEETPAEDPMVTVRFQDVPPGRYCIASFQDINSNGKIDTNFVGIPKEPYGFSRNARGRFGPPAFNEMAFDVGPEEEQLEITLE